MINLRRTVMLSLREFFRLASATLRAVLVVAFGVIALGVFSLVAFAAVIWFGISWDELAVQAHNAPVGAPVLTLINAGGVSSFRRSSFITDTRLFQRAIDQGAGTAY
jgi:hypothetical protein